MSAGIPRAFMCEFINLYKEMPCLWNPKARDYNYRSSKAAAYSILIEKYREVEPGASKETVQQRLSSLRNCRRKEYKKVKAAQEMGETYTPQLWYYNIMSFIDEPDSEEKMTSSIDKCQVEIEEPMHTFDDTNSINYTADSPAPSHESSEMAEHNEMRSGRSKSTSKRAREDDEEEEELMRYLKQRVKLMRAQPTPEPSTAANPTKYQHIAFHWADKLSSLRNEQRIFAEKLINDAFYEAEFGRLGHGCQIVPFSTQSQHIT